MSVMREVTPAFGDKTRAALHSSPTTQVPRMVSTPLSAESTSMASPYMDSVPASDRHVTVHVPADVYEARGPSQPVTMATVLKTEEVPYTQISRPVARPMSAAEALLPPPPAIPPPAIKSEFKQEKNWIFFDSAWEGLNGTLPADYVRVHLFTLAWGAIFCAPVAIALGLAKDATVQYWVGPIGLFALLVPFFLTVGYVYHVRSGRLRLMGMIISSIVPAIMLGFVGQAHLWSTTKVLTDLLYSHDCVTYAPKTIVQRAWKVADTILDECIAERAAKFEAKEDLFGGGSKHMRKGEAVNVPTRDIMKVTVEDCKRYAAAFHCSTFWGSRDHICAHITTKGERLVDFVPEWTYLKRLEAEQQCSGWCTYERPVWTLGETKDSCTVTSAEVIRSKVRPMAFMLVIVSFLIFLASWISICIAQRAHQIRHMDEVLGIAVKKPLAKS
mmetsp:Transcript_125300/g.227983  ORF Transcript_125300/g.227983 Transcript_125300/m.227983 type:complete len:443 (-) Transcript_125300:76-1404(-)